MRTWLVGSQSNPLIIYLVFTTPLQPYGSLFFAGALVLESKLPDPKDAAGAILIIRLRGLPQGRSTLVSVVERYAKKMHSYGAHLVLAELSDRICEQLEKTETC